MIFMCDLNVRFLNQNYVIPSDIVNFVKWREFEPSALSRLYNVLLSIVDRNSNMPPDEVIEYFEDDVEVLTKAMRNEANVLNKILLDNTIYDVSIDDLVENTAYEEVMQVAVAVGQKYVEIARDFRDSRIEGISLARANAAQSITGSGVCIFTNSLISAMTYCVFEGSVLSSQARKADQKFQASVAKINKITQDTFTANLEDVLIYMYYPMLSDVIAAFVHQVFANLLVNMTSHGKFDFDKMQKYSEKKSEEILQNLQRVNDVDGVLQQAFNKCPYNLNVFNQAIKYGRIDKDLLNIAHIIGYDSFVLEYIDSYIRANIKNISKVDYCLELLSQHKGVSKESLYQQYFGNEINSIISIYARYDNIMSSHSSLINYIEALFTKDAIDYINLSDNSICQSISNEINMSLNTDSIMLLISNGVITEQAILLKTKTPAASLSELHQVYDYNICQKAIRLKNNKISLNEETTRSYNRIKEEYDRLKKDQNEAYTHIDRIIKEAESELSKCGLFALSKKREINQKIKQLNEERDSITQKYSTLKDVEQELNSLYNRLHSFFDTTDV